MSTRRRQHNTLVNASIAAFLSTLTIAPIAGAEGLISADHIVITGTSSVAAAGADPQAIGGTYAKAIGGTHAKAIGGTYARAIGGTHAKAIGGTHAKAIGGTHARAIGGTHAKAIGGTYAKAIGGTHAKAIGGTYAKAIGGTHAKAIGGTYAKAIGGTHAKAIGGTHARAIGGTHAKAIGGTYAKAIGGTHAKAIGGTYLRSVDDVGTITSGVQVAVNGNQYDWALYGPVKAIDDHTISLLGYSFDVDAAALSGFDGNAMLLIAGSHDGSEPEMHSFGESFVSGATPVIVSGTVESVDHSTARLQLSNGTTVDYTAILAIAADPEISVGDFIIVNGNLY